MNQEIERGYFSKHIRDLIVICDIGLEYSFRERTITVEAINNISVVQTFTKHRSDQSIDTCDEELW